MHRFVALLRGINVGGKNLVPMAELRAAVEALGHGDVETYIQSGNVLFKSRASEAKLVLGLERRLEERFGRRLPVVLRRDDELTETVAKNPFPAAPPETLMVMFLSAKPIAAAVLGLEARRSPGDEFTVVGRDIYARCPNGFGRTKLTIDYFEKQLGCAATARNWRTVTTLAQWPSR